MISTILPIYNEETCLEEVLERLQKALASINEPYEIICVDDCSTDGTWQIIARLHIHNQSIKGLRFSRNFGHQMAIFAGIKYSSGDYLAVLDADGQDPPEFIPSLFEKCRQGYDVVYAVRQKRKEGLIKRLYYKLFYTIYKKFVPFDVPLDSGDFAIFNRKVADFLISLDEKKPFLRGLRSWYGGK